MKFYYRWMVLVSILLIIVIAIQWGLHDKFSTANYEVWEGKKLGQMLKGLKLTVKDIRCYGEPPGRPGIVVFRGSVSSPRILLKYAKNLYRENEGWTDEELENCVIGRIEMVR